MTHICPYTVFIIKSPILKALFSLSYHISCISVINLFVSTVAKNLNRISDPINQKYLLHNKDILRLRQKSLEYHGYLQKELNILKEYSQKTQYIIFKID